MFGKAKRFNDRVQAADIPGPGAYDVNARSPDRPWKKGAIAVEKQERFHDGGIEPVDTFGLYDGPLKENVKPLRPASSSLAPERARQQMEDMKHRLQSMHDKDTAKLKTKLEKTERARAEALKEKADLKATVSDLKATNTSLESQISKHAAALPLLQQKLNELVESHSASHARKDAALSSARAMLSNTAKLVAQLQQAARDALEAASLERAERDLESLKAERKLRERDAMMDVLTEYAESGDEQVEALHVELSEVTGELEWYRAELAFSREARVSEKDWRQRCRSDAREIASREEELALEREINVACLAREQLLKEELHQVRSDSDDKIGAVQTDLQTAEAALDVATNDQIPRLEESLQEATARLTEIEDDLAAAHTNLHTAFEEQETLRGELEETRRRLKDVERDVEREVVEKKRLAALLGQSRSAEAGLREELDIVNDERDQLQTVQLEHDGLVQRMDELTRRNALAESDVKQLGELNTDLLSHTNAAQRIKHVAAIRSDLVASKHAHLTTTSQLASLRRENDALRAELDAYRSVSSFPTPSGRSRVGRPNLDDVFYSSASSPESPISETTTEGSEGLMLPPPLPLPVTGRRAVSASVRKSLVASHSGSAATMLMSSERTATTSSLGRSAYSSGSRGTQDSARKMSGKMSVSELFG